ncbi:MAG: cytochrome c oxidase accessory protein CcoG [Saprospiraceae bacterium]
MSAHLTDQDQFRDHISTADEKGKRIWIYPQKPSGRFFNYRKYLSYIFLIVLFGLPFLKYDGEPLFLFNVIERKFIFFGMLFLPQDFPLFGVAMLTFIVFIVLFTAIFGRLFCGWVCPQTIFMEMVFRRIEYWIDGDANEQRRLKNREWDNEKIFKRVTKYGLFLIMSFLIANMFFSYIIGVDELGKIIREPISMHWGLFFGLFFFSLVFFFVYTYVRENVCILICPYGRLQGVLLDKKSIVVAYDYIRGEPRGKLSKENKVEQLTQETKSKGDCIDCGLCVKVCPTGIDIRNGTQLECINCTACIDACDEIMDKVKLPRGLVRYASDENIKENKPFKFSARIIGYSVVLLILLSTFLILFTSRSSVDATFLRTPGMMYQKIDSVTLGNLYNVKILNKSHYPLAFEMKVENEPAAKIQIIGNHPLQAEKGDFAVGEVFIIIPAASLRKRNTELKVGIYAAGKKVKEIKTSFIGPG